MKNIPTFEEIINQSPKEIQGLLERCGQTPQSPNWHPEAPNAEIPHNVLKHIEIVYNRARKTGDLDLAIAAFFHDLGKEKVTKPSKNTKGSWSAHGHEMVSTRLVEKYEKWIKEIGGDYLKVKEIVKQHMRIKQYDEMRPHKQKELRNNPYYGDLCRFTDCDNMLTLTESELR